MQENEPKAKAPASTEVPTLNLTINLDGTIDPEQLVGFPQEFIDRVNDPEFIADMKKRIDALRIKDLTVYRFRQRAAEVRRGAQAQAELRRPKGVSGRQRKRLRRAARKVASATILSGVETNGKSERPPN